MFFVYGRIVEVEVFCLLCECSVCLFRDDLYCDIANLELALNTPFHLRHRRRCFRHRGRRGTTVVRATERNVRRQDHLVVRQPPHAELVNATDAGYGAHGRVHIGDDHVAGYALHEQPHNLLRHRNRRVHHKTAEKESAERIDDLGARPHPNYNRRYEHSDALQEVAQHVYHRGTHVEVVVQRELRRVVVADKVRLGLGLALNAVAILISNRHSITVRMTVPTAVVAVPVVHVQVLVPAQHVQHNEVAENPSQGNAEHNRPVDGLRHGQTVHNLDRQEQRQEPRQHNGANAAEQLRALVAVRVRRVFFPRRDVRCRYGNDKANDVCEHVQRVR
eukprot:PhM_4_TR10830/c0_g1_i1/m.9488